MDELSTHNNLRIFQMLGKQWFVLLGADNQWGLERDGRLLPFATASSCMPLLPMLERPYVEIVDLIRTKLREAGKAEGLIKTFPFDLLLQRALTWEGSYWPLLAVQWLETEYPISDKFVDELQRIIGEKYYSQNLRHRAQRLIRRYATQATLRSEVNTDNGYSKIQNPKSKI